MLTAIVIGLFGCVATLDYWPKRKKRSGGQNFLYLTFWTISFVMLILYTNGITILNPTGLIKSVVEGIGSYFS